MGPNSEDRRNRIPLQQTGLQTLLQLAAKLELQLKASQLRGEARDQELAGAVLALAQKQEERGIGLRNDIDPPAITTDREGKLFKISVGTSLHEAIDPGYGAIPESLHFVSQQLARELGQKVPDLYKQGVKLFTIGTENAFPFNGATYNFAPSEIVLVSPDSLKTFNAAPTLLRGDYWSEAAKHRGLKARTISCVPRDLPHLLQSDPARSIAEKLTLPPVPTTPVPICVFDFYQRWKNHIFHTNPDGSPDLSDPAYKRLMEELHQLADINVDEFGGPFAAALIDRTGKLRGVGVNRVAMTSNALAHGERVSLQNAFQSADISADAELTLQNGILVTSSETCIACAEQARNFKIKYILFGNSRQAVEDLTRFTEGPLHDELFRESGIRVHQIQTEEIIATAALRKFASLLEADSARDYLQRSD